MVLVCFSTGCNKRENKAIKPTFGDFYEQYEPKEKKDQSMRFEDRRLTLAVRDLPLLDFARVLHDEFDVTIILQEGLTNKKVTIEAKDQPLADVIRFVGRSLDTDVVEAGPRLWYIGSESASDRSTIVLRLPRLGRDDLISALETIGGADEPKIFVSNDGLAVITDDQGGLSRIMRFKNEIEMMPSPTWAVQLYVVSMSERQAWEFGFQVNHAVSIAGRFADASGGPAFKASSIDASLDALLIADRETSQAVVDTRPLMLCADGEDIRFFSGETIPIPERTVSDNGTVTESGYTFQDIGFEVNLMVREMSSRHSKIRLELTQSRIIELINDEVPRTSTDTLQTVATVISGGTYLLGSITRQAGRKATQGPLVPAAWSDSKEKIESYVFARVYRIAGQYRSPTLAQTDSETK